MSLLLGITLCFRSCDFDISFSVLKEAGLLAFEVLTVSVVPMQCLWMHSHVLPWWNFETARDLRGGSATMFFLLSMGRSETPRGIWISQANVLFKQTRITNSLIRKTTIQWVRLNAVFYLSACEVWGLFFKLSLAFLVATNCAVPSDNICAHKQKQSHIMGLYNGVQCYILFVSVLPGVTSVCAIFSSRKSWSQFGG